MDIMTSTQTKTSTNTKLIVATAFLAASAAFAMIPKINTTTKFQGCKDPDAPISSTFAQNQLFTRSTTTYNSGSRTDYCYTFPTTKKTYLMEGVCKNGGFQTWQKNCGELNIGKTGVNYQCVQGACVDTLAVPTTTPATTTTQARLSVSLASESPAAKLLAAGTTVTLAAFNFLPTTSEDIQLHSISLTQVVTDLTLSSYRDYEQIWFEDQGGAEIAGTRMAPSTIKPMLNFSTNAFVLRSTDTSGKRLYLKAKLTPIGMTASTTSGHRVGYKIESISDISAKTLSSVNVPITFSLGQPTSATHYVYKSYPVFTKLSTGNSVLSNSTEDLFKFSVTAVNGPVALNGFTFDISTTTAKVVPGSLYLYDVTDFNELQINETGGVGKYYQSGTVFQTVGWNNDWDTSYTADEITVPVGTPRIFVLRGNITGAVTGAAIVTGMAGDSMGVAMQSVTGVDAQSHDDFIWSDKSSSGHTVSTGDWINGYLVPGLAFTTSSLEVVSF